MPETPTAHITAHTPLENALTAWEIYLQDQGRSPHTIKAFTADVRLLGEYHPPKTPIGNFSAQDINNFLQWMQTERGKPCSPKTLARRITSIKAFFRWLHQYAILLIDPAETVVQRTVHSPLPQVLTPAEQNTARLAAEWYRSHPENPDLRHSLLLNLLLATGIKKGECLAIHPNHIDLEAPTGPILFIRYASPQHRLKERKIPLPAAWVEDYKAYRSLYPDPEKIFPWSPRRLEYLLEDISNRAGIEKHISFDMCRWTCALNDLQSGMETEKIRQKLGISKIQWREVSLKLRRLNGETIEDEPAAPDTATP
ncbi:MAG: tyrosine recombinase XerA [Anaerolineales bacterium]